MHIFYNGTCSQVSQVTTDVGTNKCTRSHGGTSAAAPNAVGIFALALSVRWINLLLFLKSVYSHIIIRLFADQTFRGGIFNIYALKQLRS